MQEINYICKYVTVHVSYIFRGFISLFRLSSLQHNAEQMPEGFEERVLGDGKSLIVWDGHDRL